MQARDGERRSVRTLTLSVLTCAEDAPSLKIECASEVKPACLPRCRSNERNGEAARAAADTAADGAAAGTSPLSEEEPPAAPAEDASDLPTTRLQKGQNSKHEDSANRMMSAR